MSKKVWILTTPDGGKDYFTSAKKAYDNCQLWLEIVKKEKISPHSHSIAEIKKYGFGYIYNEDGNINYRIDSVTLR